MADEDMTTTLGALERKLKALEAELQAPVQDVPRTVPDAPAPAPSASRSRSPLSPEPVFRTTVAPAPSPPAQPAAPVVAPADGAQSQLDALLRFRKQLERSARELMNEYERMLSALQVTTGVVGGPVALPGTDAPPAAPWQDAPVAAPASGFDETMLDGAITVDAGPFTDIDALSGFEQALGSVPGVQDVYLRGFEGDRASIDVTLGQPVALGTELRRRSPVAFAVTAVDAGRVTVAIHRG